MDIARRIQRFRDDFANYSKAGQLLAMRDPSKFMSSIAL